MSRELKDAISQLAGTFNRDFVSIVACTVQTVDVPNRQCTCIPLNGTGEAAITVNLSAEPNDGILVTPSANSTVLVAQTTQNDPFVLMTSDIDGISIITNDGISQFIISLEGSIQFNDGTYGGLVQVMPLVQKLNNLENLINGLIDKFNSHTHATTCPAGAGSTALTTTTEPGSISPVTQQDDLENKLITHGQ